MRTLPPTSDADRAPPGRGLRQPEHPTGLRRRAAAARRLARRPAAPRCDPGRLPRRAARRRPRGGERLDGGCRGVLPREARRATESVRRTDRQGARRLPADRRLPRPRPSRPVQRLRPRGGARHVPPLAPARAWHRVRRGGRRAWPCRCCDRGPQPAGDAPPRRSMVSMCSRTCRPRARTASGSAGAVSCVRRRSSPSVGSMRGAPRNARTPRAVMRSRIRGYRPDSCGNTR